MTGPGTKIHVGDCLETLRAMPPESVHCVITSPPYWGLRAYKGDTGMIGLERTFSEHIENLVRVFGEVRRVLRKDGTCWLNYGDAYCGYKGENYPNADPSRSNLQKKSTVPSGHRRGTPQSTSFKTKDLMMMPARVAMALQDDGWWLRSEIVWHKPNPMPESVTDRPTSAHEKLFLLTKAARYFYDAEAVRVTGVGSHSRGTGGKTVDNEDRNDTDRLEDSMSGTVTANLRNVWKIATAPFRGAHFATFPPALVEPCVKAGTSEKGCCPECGAPWKREVELAKTGDWSRTVDRGGIGQNQASSGEDVIRVGGSPYRKGYQPPKTTGWRPTCEHDAEPVPCTVLDPFGGAGTVGLVANRLGRCAIIIEINAEYAQMAEHRILDDGPLFSQVEVGP